MVKTKTITLQIGNSDDKLTQGGWSNFVRSMEKVVTAYMKETHFFGCSASDAQWQNACWVFDIEDDDLVRDARYRHVADMRKQYKQDSAAFTEGKTLFV